MFIEREYYGEGKGYENEKTGWFGWLFIKKGIKKKEKKKRLKLKLKLKPVGSVDGECPFSWDMGSGFLTIA